jgi:tRNA(Ile)-lysidine synthase
VRQFTKSLVSEWRKLKLPRKENSVIIGVSGGADSVSLLASLHELQTSKKLNLKIIVAHFNHNLRQAESREDAEFVRNLAQKFNLEFVCGSPASDIRKSESNLEQASRKARYNFLCEAADLYGAFAVLTGHTLDDQAETFLLRLMRGSGADGLAAMQPITFLKSEIRNSKSELKLVRPLLTWARRQMTQDYCAKLGLGYQHDSMNDDENFARVRVRKQLMPLLKTFNPKIVEILANTASLLREDADELNVQARRFLNENNFSLLANNCQLLTVALRRRILRLWLKHFRGDLRQIGTKHLRAIETLILNEKGGRTIELPGGGAIKRQAGKLIFIRQVEKTRFDI